MSPRKTPYQPGLGPDSLFTEVGGAIVPNPTVLVGPEVAPDPAAPVVTETVLGPSVNLAERAEHLQEALDTIAKMSRTTGLSIASMGPARRQLERTNDDVDALVGRAEAAQPERLRHTKQEFAKAIGMDAMIASGLVTEQEAKASAHEDFQDFMAKYSGSRNHDALDYKRRELAWGRKVAAGERTRKPRRKGER